MDTNNPFPQPICEQIWNEKYRLITPNPDIKDDSNVQDTWMRIAKACGNSPPEIYGDIESPNYSADLWTNRYYNTLKDFKFLPAGRITAGAGSGRMVTLFNCYVMGTIPDSLPGIFDNLKEAAITMQQGGGIGYDFSPLRPIGAPVKKVDADASGPLSFMDVWDAMCRTIMSAGSRRGAMMATMSCTHPDVMKFIEAKRDSAKLRMFNVSVLCTDDFMTAVLNDREWALSHKVAPEDTSLGKTAKGEWIYQIVSAKELWEAIMRTTYDVAEPGVLFIERINKFNNLWYIEDIQATNPCGEQPLPPYGACLLGSVNMAKMVINPFTKDASIDVSLLESTTRVAVRMLDAVIDISEFPLEAQKAEAKAKRRMGIGMTALGDAIFMLNLRYGSPRAADKAEQITKIMTLAAYRESIVMAIEYGPCPATETFEQRAQFCQSAFMVNMPSDIRDGVMAHGIRNALLMSIAPTGTISLYAGNLSSGVEPIFAKGYTRKVLQKDGTRREEYVYDAAVLAAETYLENFQDIKIEDMPNFVTAQDLTPMDHLVMQAAVQKWIDSSISKTINCPEDISFDDFQQIYLDAYAMGCKGCTTYRPNAVTGSVLSVDKPTEPVAVPNLSVDAPEPVVEPMPRPEDLSGQTYKLRWGEDAIYVTINNIPTFNEGVEAPFEIFINSKRMDHYQWTIAVTRLMSAVFRRGGDVGFIVEELKSVFDPNGGQFVKGLGYVPSFIALLGHTLQKHMELIGYRDALVINGPEPEEQPSPLVAIPEQCPNCKGFNLNLTLKCPTCLDCGHSKCG
jgi:ribonucleoside-diphosphate reductase alpha chain